MYIFVLIVHVVVCFVLIAVVLLQAGRGGGFSDMMGGGQPQSIFGTQTNAFMTRATEVCAVIFIITSLTLGIMSTHKGKSLMERDMLKNALKARMPVNIPLPPKVPQAPVQPMTAVKPGSEEAVASGATPVPAVPSAPSPAPAATTTAAATAATPAQGNAK